MNEAWKASFARKSTNINAIRERGWGPLNRNLLKYREVHNSMTNEERLHYEACNGLAHPPTDSLQLPSPSSETSLVSDLTDPSMNVHAPMDLNYSSGNSAMVIDTLVAANDLFEARERIRKKRKLVRRFRPYLTVQRH